MTVESSVSKRIEENISLDTTLFDKTGVIAKGILTNILKNILAISQGEEPTSQDCLQSIIFRMVFLSAWCTNAVAVAFIY